MCFGIRCCKDEWYKVNSSGKGDYGIVDELTRVKQKGPSNGGPFFYDFSSRVM